MKPSPLRYFRPTSLPDALDVLAQLGDEGKVLAGGQSLIPLLSMRIAAPPALVDINSVPGLDQIIVDGGTLRFGALVRHTDLERSDAAFAAQPLLRRALLHVAHPTIRNRGTTVGSIVHSDPSAEFPAVLTLLGGSVVAHSVNGGQQTERKIPASEFFVGPLESALRPDELAVAVEVPVAQPGEGTALIELARRHGDYAMCGVVAKAVVDGDQLKSLHATYISTGEMGTVVDLGAEAGSVAVDQVDTDALGAFARKVVETDADIHATAEYRSQLVQVLTARAVRAAIDDAVNGARKEAS
ncbi:MAG TPA: FAD binding domain-containing protein [Actinomycetales bacterium]|nr:FAD binding domain-containing protein [Actinomycetales bacterium]